MNRQVGFTLVELVTSIVLTAIVLGFATLFMTTPVDAYFAQTRRTELLGTADDIKQPFERDLGRALPNSVRIRNAGSRAIVEMILVDQVGFFSTTATDTSTALQLKSFDQNFAVFGQIIPGRTANYELTGELNGARLVVGNSVTNNAYALNSKVITPATTKIDVAPNAGIDAIKLTPAFNFNVTPPPSKSRIFLVSTPVTYICNSAAGARSLRRYSGYAIYPGIPTAETSAQLAGASDTLLATGISSCVVACTAIGAGSICQKALALEMQVSRAAAAGNESIRVFSQVALDDAP